MMRDVACETCRYWEDFGPDLEMGQCRLYPPQVFALLGAKSVGALTIQESRQVYEYPETPRSAWCGQHKPGNPKSD